MESLAAGLGEWAERLVLFVLLISFVLEQYRKHQAAGVALKKAQAEASGEEARAAQEATAAADDAVALLRKEIAQARGEIDDLRKALDLERAQTRRALEELGKSELSRNEQVKRLQSRIDTLNQEVDTLKAGVQILHDQLIRDDKTPDWTLDRHDTPRVKGKTGPLDSRKVAG